MSNEGMIAQNSASSLIVLFKPENKSHFKLMKDQNFLEWRVFW